ncbi:MAG: S8 family serine peptidase, partial [Methanomicrobiaceae archaeon]|nr:S8 family serine peptidase [Methanomicrobiaceae archaeon]
MRFINIQLFGVAIIALFLLTPLAAAAQIGDIGGSAAGDKSSNKSAFFSEKCVLQGSHIQSVERVSDHVKTDLPNYIPNELIVEFKGLKQYQPTLINAVIEQTHAQIGAQVKKDYETIGLSGVQLVRIPDMISLDEALAYYRTDPNVLSVSPNYIHTIDCVPDDPSFSSLWGLSNTGQTGGTIDADIDAPEAWDIVQGSSDVVVAVIDTGVDYTHPDLNANIWTNSGEIPDNGIDDDQNGYIDDYRGWDFVNGDKDPYDDQGHGTHCAGTIAAVGNNYIGITGVSWNAKIMPLKAGDYQGYFLSSDELEAFQYAAMMGADVISCSFGGAGYVPSVESVIAASPAVVMCAAGNSGENNDISQHYPSNYNCPNIISVAATDHNDNKAWFSNYGASTVDIAAPGVNIYSTVPSFTTIFSDSMSNLNNWNVQSPWGLSSSVYYSSPSSAADSPGGYYQNYADCSLSLKNPLNLASLKSANLNFIFTGNAEYGYDGLLIEVSHDGGTWECIDAITGDYSQAFYLFEGDLSDYCGDSSVYLRLRFISDELYTYDGYYIDDVSISVSNSEQNAYTSMSGTSMATPHVSGLAALVKAANPSLSNIAIKEAILSTADEKASLNGVVATGGRINAYHAVYDVAEICDSSSISDTIPASMTAGQPYEVQVTMQNTGTNAWSEND